MFPEDQSQPAWCVEGVEGQQLKKRGPLWASSQM